MARAKSAALVVQRLRKKFADQPVILTGDFNTTPGSVPYETLVRTKDTKERVYQDSFDRSATRPKGPRSTWNGFRAIVPNRRIDFVFVAKSVRVLQHRILDEQRNGRFPSDHLPVLAEIELSKSRSK